MEERGREEEEREEEMQSGRGSSPILFLENVNLIYPKNVSTYNLPE